MRPLHHIFAETVRTHGECEAVDAACVRPRRALTYNALAQRAGGIARRVMHSAPRAVGGAQIVVIAAARQDDALYAAQLGTNAAGAAWTVIDPSFPDDHAARILADAQPCLVLCDAEAEQRMRRIAACPVVPVDSVPRAELDDALALLEGPCDAHSLAYLIYTSGTTGAPKGVLIEHASVATLVEGDREEFRLEAGDRVAQCSSGAYDSSVEEMWLAFASGAALVPIDDETLRSGPDLAEFLRRERITVFCPPPTLLRSLGCVDPERELPGVRLIYVGGEALPQDVSDQWSRGRRLENGYGPTECTITVVRATMRAGVPVSIGRPIPGSRAHILDEALRPVADGEVGELCISGASLARGYRSTDAIDGERFTHIDGPSAARTRIYRTGDLARRLPDGTLECLGRRDGQVKVRGHRVELGAVEAACTALPGVREAGVRLHGTGSTARLVAFLVAEPCEPALRPSLNTLRATLASALPAAHVPARLEWIDQLPRSTAGKLDRAQLPGPEAPRPAASVGDHADATDPLAIVNAAAALVLELNALPCASDDFFVDLGGDSLATTGLVVTLRKHDGFRGVTVRDIIESRTLAAIAGKWSIATVPRAPRRAARRAWRTHARPGLVSAIQAGCVASEWMVYGSLVAVACFWLLPRLIPLVGVGTALFLVALCAPGARAAWLLATVIATRAAKSLLIGRTVAGRVDVWSMRWLRHWIVARMATHIPWRLVESTVLQGAVLRILGARVGARVDLDPGVAIPLASWDLLEIGDDAVIGTEVVLQTARHEDGQVVFAPVAVGARTVVGTRAIVGSGTHTPADSTLAPLERSTPESDLAEHAQCGSAETRAAHARSRFSVVAHASWVFFSRAWAGFIPVLAIVAFLNRTSTGMRLSDLVESWLMIPRFHLGWSLLIGVGVGAVAAFALAGDAISCRLMGRCREGRHARFGAESIRVLRKLDRVSGAASWLSGSRLWVHWLRGAGMRIGPHAELSTISGAIPELVEVGERSFLADGAYFQSASTTPDHLELSITRLGAQTFTGNYAVLDASAHHTDGLFVGVATVTPSLRHQEDQRDVAWVGQPPMPLPRATPELENHLLRPSLARRARRAAWEWSRFLLPVAPTVLMLAGYTVLIRWGSGASWPVRMLLASAIAALLSAALLVSLVALKWILLGRVRAARREFWSGWTCRWEFHYMAWEIWSPAIMECLRGTFAEQWVYRALGAHIGRGVALATGGAEIVDPDLIHYDHHSTVAGLLQAHSFEDRVLSMDTLRVGAGATVGEHALLMAGSAVGEGAVVAPGAVLLKGQRVESGSYAAGSPAQER